MCTSAHISSVQVAYGNLLFLTLALFFLFSSQPSAVPCLCRPGTAWSSRSGVVSSSPVTTRGSVPTSGVTARRGWASSGTAPRPMVSVRGLLYYYIVLLEKRANNPISLLFRPRIILNKRWKKNPNNYDIPLQRDLE